MDPINIIVAINLFVSMSANLSAAKKGMKSKLSNVVERPKSYLQKYPPNVAAIVLVLTILAIFNIGVLNNEIKEQFIEIRVVGLILFLIFSWIQVYSFKNLGVFYSQDILIFKGHELKKDGLYKIIRHPQYVSQLVSDLGVGIALMGYLIVPIVVLIELPLFYLRAKNEEKLLLKHFKEDFEEYRKKTGFFIPFVG